jgi:hypothetical protein
MKTNNSAQPLEPSIRNGQKWGRPPEVVYIPTPVEVDNIYNLLRITAEENEPIDQSNNSTGYQTLIRCNVIQGVIEDYGTEFVGLLET